MLSGVRSDQVSTAKEPRAWALAWTVVIWSTSTEDMSEPSFMVGGERPISSAACKHPYQA
jgi:hypothetical protein